MALTPEPSTTPTGEAIGGFESLGSLGSLGGLGGLGGLGRRDWLRALAVALGAFALLLAMARLRGFWLDEYYTYFASGLPLRELVANRIRAGHSPLYFIYASFGHALGGGERAMRASSALAAALNILALTGLAGALGLRRQLGAIWAVSLVLPYWILCGTELRYMMTLLAAASATAWAAVRYAQALSAAASGAWRRGALLAMLCALLLWIHGSAQFIVGALLIFLLWDALAEAPRAARPARLLAACWPPLAGLLASAPLLYLVRNHPNDMENDPPSLPGLVRNLLEATFSDYELWPRLLGRSGDLLLAAEGLVLVGAIALAWRELRRRAAAGSPEARRAWRLLASLLGALPLVMLIVCVGIKNFQGPARYVAAFSIPAALCLAIAWHARIEPRWRWAWRAALVAVLAIQSSAAVFDRGDRHREGIRWIVAHHTGAEPILTCLGPMNHVALAFHGLSNPTPLCTTIPSRFKKDPAAVRAQISSAFAGATRGFYVLYHTPVPARRILDEMVDSGELLDQRRFRLSHTVTVGAIIRDERDREWLESLPMPERLWGPGHYDFPRK